MFWHVRRSKTLLLNNVMIDAVQKLRIILKNLPKQGQSETTGPHVKHNCLQYMPSSKGTDHNKHVERMSRTDLVADHPAGPLDKADIETGPTSQL